MTKQGLRRNATLLPPGGLRGGVMTLLSGSTAAIALAYLAQPLLTRLYTPTDFGTLDAFGAIVATIGPILSLRYEDAVLLPEDDDEAAGVLWLSIALTGLLATLALVLVPLSGPLAAALGHPELAPWIALVPLALVFERMVKLTGQWLKRKKRFRSLSAGEVTLTLGSASSRVGAGLLLTGVGAAGLIGGYLVGLFSAASLLVILAARTDLSTLRRGICVARMRHALHRYRRFPVYSTPALLLKSMATRLPILLLLAFFDERVVGHYGRAFMILIGPLSMIGAAISKVYAAESARLYHRGGVTDLTSSVHSRMVLIGLFPTLVLMLAGPDILTVVLGEDWGTTGEYLRYLGPWLFFTMMTMPFGSLFDILERQRGDLLLSGVMFTLQTGALVLAAQTGDIVTTLLALGLAGAVVRALHLGVMLRLAGVRWTTALYHHGRGLAVALPFLLPVGLAMAYAPPLVVCAAAIFTGASYFALVWWRGWL